MDETYRSAAYTLTVDSGDQTFELKVKAGSNLRKSLFKAGLSPYTRYTEKLNCGGRGLCATCGVWIIQPPTAPTHWHDRLAEKYGYPRLSCQISINTDMHIRLETSKKIWGKRKRRK